MRRYGADRQHSRIAFGVILVVVGAVALLDKLNLFDSALVRPYWPLALVVLGLLRLQQTRHAGGYLVAAVLVVAGLGMTLRNLGIIQVQMRDWWPVFLILGGLLVMSRGLRPTVGKQDDAVPALAGGPLEHGARINATAMLSGNVLQSDAQAFQGGELTAIMGGLECDLRRANIGSQAVLQVFVLMGSIQLKVPTDWSVLVNGLPILGGVDDSSVPPAQGGKRLVVEGYVIMGGLEIKN